MVVKKKFPGKVDMQIDRGKSDRCEYGTFKMFKGLNSLSFSVIIRLWPQN
jgi:hypothetical protein